MPEVMAAKNVVSFSTSAVTEIVKDTLSVTLQVVREGSDAAAVQAALKQVLDAALTEARKQVQVDALEVRTGSFHVGPRYGRDGKISGWQGSAELQLEGRDIARVAATAGKLQSMNVTSTGFSVSRALRERLEADLIAQAVQKFRTRAAALAQQFGFSNYTLKEVQVQGVESDNGRPMVMMSRALAKEASTDAAMPVEAGRSLLTATVQGSVALTN